MNICIVLVFLLVLHNKVDCMNKNGKKTCSLLTTVSQNIPQTLLLKNPTAGLNLKICQSNLTCCSKQMENELYKKSSRVLKGALHQQTNATHNFFTTKASQFDNYFTNLIETAKVKWHKMLLLTYKDIYARNRHIFDDFFSALEQYYKNGGVDLDHSFNLFFQRIQNTMFILINTKLANQPGFLNCTAKHIDDIQPFGKYQAQITTQLKSTLTYARKFVMGLQAGSNATASIINYLSRNECIEGFTKIQHCSVCEGIPNALVCNATCHNVLQSCFVFDSNFETYWSDCIRGLHMLSSGLDGQYDFEAVLGQVAYDISSAIMEFQSNFISVLTKAKSLCPSGGRGKRAIDRSGSDLYLEGERVRRSSQSDYSSAARPQQLPLDTYTTAFRKELIMRKDVWRNLPRKICGGQTFVSRNQSESCWNGKDMQKNSEKVPSLKLISGDAESRRLIVEQLMNLKQIVEIAKKDPEPVNGDDASSGEPEYSGSGSASGEGSASGSGDPTIRIPTVIIANVRTTVGVDNTDSVGSGATPVPLATTDQIKVIPTKDRSMSSTDGVIVTDETDEASGTPPIDYATTPKSLINKPTLDDEDLEFSGSGGGNDSTTDEPTTWTDSIIMFNPTREDTRVSIIKGTPDLNNGSENMIRISYVSLLLVTLVGLMNV